MRKLFTARAVLLLLLSMLLMACQLTLLEPEEGEDGGVGSISQAPAASAAVANLSALEQTLVQRSVDDLAAAVGVAVDDISLMEIEAVEWPDASLGCPQPDMMYAQVITNGYRILLEANGETYDYHTDVNEDGYIVRCENEE